MEEMQRPAASDRTAEDPQPDGRPDYVPPTAEDIDTTHSPAETIPGGSGTPGVEESDRWH